MFSYLLHVSKLGECRWTKEAIFGGKKKKKAVMMPKETGRTVDNSKKLYPVDLGRVFSLLSSTL